MLAASLRSSDICRYRTQYAALLSMAAAQFEVSPEANKREK